MDRRDVIKLGVAATVAGCAGAPPVAPSLSAQEADAILADLDATLARMRSARPDPEPFLGSAKLDSVRLQQGHELVTKALASMHLAATFRELPNDIQLRQDVQDRMWRAMPDMDDAMLSLTDFLQKLTPAERRALQERFRDDPELGMKVVEKLDGRAKTFGVGAKRRTQMRTAAAHVTWRMKNQSVDALLDECIDKTRKVVERNGRDAEVQRAAAAKLTELGLFGPPAGGSSHLTLATSVPGESRHGSGGTVLIVGAVLLGVGAIVAGSGGLIIATDGGIGGAFLITAGAVIGFAAIIVLIVGAVLYANESARANRRTESDDE